MFWEIPVKNVTHATHGRTPAVVVMGGSRGIGLAIAARFARAGNTVVLVARSESSLESGAASLKDETRARVETLALDITSATAPAALDAALESHALACEVLVISAAMGLSGPFASHASADIDRLIELNIGALTRFTRHVLPAMRDRGHGSIINIASLGGYVPGPHQAAYYASKSYVISLSEALAAEMAGTGVHVMAVAPGPVATNFHRDMGAEGSRYRIWLPELTPKRVANATYVGYLLRWRVVVPGVLNSLVSVLLRVVPHRISVAIAGWLLDAPRS